MEPLVGEGATETFVGGGKGLEGPDVGVRVEAAVGLCGLADIGAYVKDNLSIGDQARLIVVGVPGFNFEGLLGQTADRNRHIFTH